MPINASAGLFAGQYKATRQAMNKSQAFLYSDIFRVVIIKQKINASIDASISSRIKSYKA